MNEFEIEFDIKPNEFEIEMKGVVQEIYPELKDLEITPSKEEQNFSGSYGNIKVNPIETKELNVVPSKEQQNFEGLYGNVKVDRVTSDIDPSIKPENIKKGANILGVEGEYEVIVEDLTEELTEQNNLLSTQEITIDNIITALEGKSASDGLILKVEGNILILSGAKVEGGVLSI